MLFNSFEFAVFLPIVFGLYWLIGRERIRLQNFLLLTASYVFYGWWDWRFLSLILFSSCLDFFLGREIEKSPKANQRKVFLLVSILINLSFLGVFKYYNFFLENFIEAFRLFGHRFEASTLNIILPVGISFYTFQTLSYSIDIYRGKMSATKDFVAFGAFVSFFPQLVAGPIERATNLLPQFHSRRTFEYDKAVDGCRQILWGLFKKMVIADNCAYYVNQVFADPSSHNASSLALGAVLFAFQIYGDFSGYSDIAIGTSRLFGFNLMRNFAFPYFSRDVAEFWRRWHISLSTWFRDYLYIPLGGSQGSKVKQIRNVFIIFLVSGFWHGANWTFIFWGLLNALYFLPYLLTGSNRKNIENVHLKHGMWFKDLLSILGTFILICFAWIFFRSDDMTTAFKYVASIFDVSIFSIPSIMDLKLLQLNVFLVFFLVLEWLMRHGQHGLDFGSKEIPKFFRWILYYLIAFLIIWTGGAQQDFIYFQF